jgi:hypothetical protein
MMASEVMDDARREKERLILLEDKPSLQSVAKDYKFFFCAVLSHKPFFFILTSGSIVGQ